MSQLFTVLLTQLAESDEVIVVDDHSSDETCAVIRALDDARVRLIEHTANQILELSRRTLEGLRSCNLSERSR